MLRAISLLRTGSMVQRRCTSSILSATAAATTHHTTLHSYSHVTRSSNTSQRTQCAPLHSQTCRLTTTPASSSTTPSTKPDASTPASDSSTTDPASASSATSDATTQSTPTSSSSSEQSQPQPADENCLPGEEVLSKNERRFFRFSEALVGGIFGLAIGKLLWFLFDSPAVLDEVVKAAEEDELIQARVGSPVKWSIFWSGNANETNASLVIPISGPKGDATLHARAFYDKHFQAWKLMLLQASFDSTEGAQKHTLMIPDRYVVKPRYVSPEEMERMQKRHQDMIKKLEQQHAKPKTNQTAAN